MSVSPASRATGLIPKISNALTTTKNGLVRVFTPPRLIQKAYRNILFSPKVGLTYDDITKRNFYAKGVLNEAVERLPPQAQEERAFRIKRAVMLSGNKTTLKKKDRLTLAKESHYLEYYTNSVICDIELRNYWDLNGEAPAEQSNLISREQYIAGLEKMIGNMEPTTESK